MGSEDDESRASSVSERLSSSDGGSGGPVRKGEKKRRKKKRRRKGRGDGGGFVDFEAPRDDDEEEEEDDEDDDGDDKNRGGGKGKGGKRKGKSGGRSGGKDGAPGDDSEDDEESSLSSEKGGVDGFADDGFVVPEGHEDSADPSGRKRKRSGGKKRRRRKGKRGAADGGGSDGGSDDGAGGGSGGRSGESGSGGSSAVKVRRKRRKGTRDNSDLSEDDYALIEEQAGIKRPRGLKRLRKKDDGGEGGAAEGGDDAAGAPIAAKDVVGLKESLFSGMDDDDDDDDGARGAGRGDDGAGEDEYSYVTEDEEDQFIVYDDEDVDGKRRRRRRRKGTRAAGALAGAAAGGKSRAEIDEGMREGHEIFGSGGLDELFDSDDDKFDETIRRHVGGAAAAGGGGIDVDADADDADDDADYDPSGVKSERRGSDADAVAVKSEHEPGVPRGRRVPAAPMERLNRLRAAIEPGELRRNFITEHDFEVRAEDCPERWQLRYPDRAVPADEDIIREAEWITLRINENLPQNRAVVLHGSDAAAVEMTRTSITNALTFLIKDRFEVPYIATYLRDFLGMLENVHLWEIERLDKEYYELHCSRESTLRRLKVAPENVQFDLGEFVRYHGDDAQALEDVNDRITMLSQVERAVAVRERQDARAAAAAAADGDGDGDGERDGDRDGDSDTAAAVDRKPFAVAGAAAGAVIDVDAAAAAGGSAVDRAPTVENPVVFARRHGLDVFANEWIITAAQFGENLEVMQPNNSVPIPDLVPAELAIKYCAAGDRADAPDAPDAPDAAVRPRQRGPATPKDVLAATRRMIVFDMAHDPRVRTHVRQRFLDDARVSTYPTKAGRAVVDPFHVYGSVHKLRGKPVRDLMHPEACESWLLITKAEEEGLLTVRITASVEDDHGDAIVDEAAELLSPPDASDLASLWKEERLSVLRTVYSEHLRPAAVRHVRTTLDRRAREGLSRVCADRLRGILSRQPWRPSLEDQRKIHSRALRSGTVSEVTLPRLYPRTLGFVMGPNGRGAHGVLANEHGDVVADLALSSLPRVTMPPRGVDIKTDPADDWSRRGDYPQLKRFLREHRPQVVVLGIDGMHCQMFLRAVTIIAESLGGTLSPTGEPLQVLCSPLDTAHAFAYSDRAEGAHKAMSIEHRMALSVARRLQDPVAEFASVVAESGDGADGCRALSLHWLQDRLADADLRAAIDAALVEAVNDAAVDINRCVAHPHLAGLIPFVAGLGPRKAKLVVASIERSPLRARDDLVSRELVGPKVFANMAGFVFVERLDNPPGCEALDATRVHPRHYDLARQIVVDVREVEQLREGSLNADVRDVRGDERLDDLDLVAYANVLVQEEASLGRIVETLRLIAAELRAPLADGRAPWRDVDETELFRLLTGEDPASLRPGTLVNCTVVRINGPGAVCRLESGVTAFLPVSMISATEHVADPADRLIVGAVLRARVMELEVSKLQVRVSTRSTDLREPPRRLLPRSDPYLAEDDERDPDAPEESDKDRASRAARVARAQRYARAIDHPRYRNCTREEAEADLADKESGSALFRPSQRGADRLTLTWKWDDAEPLINVDVMEHNREEQAALGTRLVIGGEEYEDLDEILINYVRPVADYMAAMKRCGKYQALSYDEVCAHIRTESANNPKFAKYYVIPEPGAARFTLAYEVRSKNSGSVSIKREPISVSPEGYKYRQQIFSSWDDLKRFFQRNSHKPPPRPQPAHDPAAASALGAGPGQYAPMSGYSGYPDHPGGAMGGYDSYSGGGGGYGAPPPPPPPPYYGGPGGPGGYPPPPSHEYSGGGGYGGGGGGGGGYPPPPPQQGHPQGYYAPPPPPPQQPHYMGGGGGGGGYSMSSGPPSYPPPPPQQQSYYPPPPGSYAPPPPPPGDGYAQRGYYDNPPPPPQQQQQQHQQQR